MSKQDFVSFVIIVVYHFVAIFHVFIFLVVHENILQILQRLNIGVLADPLNSIILVQVSVQNPTKFKYFLTTF